MKKILAFLAVLLLVFVSCENPSGASGNGTGDEKPYVGTWYATDGLFYYSVNLKSDGTFQYFDTIERESSTGSYTVADGKFTFVNDGESEEGIYSYTIADGQLSMVLVSDSDTYRQNIAQLNWTSTAPATYTVSGSITLPESVSQVKYYVGIDTNDDGGDGMNYISGVANGTSIDYSIDYVPSGTFYLYFVADLDGTWDDEDAGPVANGDYWAFYDMAGGNPPDSATLTISADRTIDLTAATYVSSTEEGTSTVSGTITLPASVSDKTYYICLDTNTDGSDGMTGYLSDKVTGTSIPYSFTNVSDGTYYLYAIVDMDGSGGGISSGDYWMFYGMVNSNPGTASAFTVADEDVSIDMTLVAYQG